LITALFCDLVGSTELGERLDAELLHKVLDRYFHAMREGGVFLAPSQFEAAFVSLAHGDDDLAAAARACRGAMEKAR